ncbi:MAG: hypothetical protein JRC90_05755 [Deltaproteobacteria bacterium]|nr:hypothetical protein [Deltaproteobacteria bacterium]
MKVSIVPMPEAYMKIKKKLRPQHPPIFQGTGESTLEDIELARELFRLLDDESKEWYGRRGIFEGL